MNDLPFWIDDRGNVLRASRGHMSFIQDRFGKEATYEYTFDRDWIRVHIWYSDCHVELYNMTSTKRRFIENFISDYSYMIQNISIDAGADYYTAFTIDDFTDANFHIPARNLQKIGMREDMKNIKEHVDILLGKSVLESSTNMRRIQVLNRYKDILSGKENIDLWDEPQIIEHFKYLFDVGHLIKWPGGKSRDDIVHEFEKTLKKVGWADYRIRQMRDYASGGSKWRGVW